MNVMNMARCMHIWRINSNRHAGKLIMVVRLSMDLDNLLVGYASSMIGRLIHWALLLPLDSSLGGDWREA